MYVALLDALGCVSLYRLHARGDVPSAVEGAQTAGVQGAWAGGQLPCDGNVG
jgi:hypothetical protein